MGGSLLGEKAVSKASLLACLDCPVNGREDGFGCGSVMGRTTFVLCSAVQCSVCGAGAQSL